VFGVPLESSESWRKTLQNQHLKPKSAGQNHSKPAVAVRWRTPFRWAADVQKRLVTKRNRGRASPRPHRAKYEFREPPKGDWPDFELPKECFREVREKLTGLRVAHRVNLKKATARLNTRIMAYSCQTLKPSKTKG
jgi:hypothetical protein